MSSTSKSKRWAGRGTLLNFATVLVGALLGLALQSILKPDWLLNVRVSLGVVTICFGLGMFLKSKNPVLVALAVALGGLVGTIIGIQDAIQDGAGWLQMQIRGDENFASGLIVTSVLFCVGPMTLLGCIRDAIDRNIDLLKMKATMDGIVAVFFAAAFGSGVLVTAFVVLVFQGLLTLLAAPLRSIADDAEMVDEITGVGGPVLVLVGIGLTGLMEVESANYLPSLVFAPLLVLFFRYVSRRHLRPAPSE